MTNNDDRNIDDILAKYRTPDLYEQEKQNCLLQAVRTLIGDQYWSPSWFLDIVRANGQRYPLEELHHLERMGIHPKLKVWPGEQIEWDGRHMIDNECGAPITGFPPKQVIFYYLTENGGDALCVLTDQLREYDHLPWDAVIMVDPAWNNKLLANYSLSQLPERHFIWHALLAGNTISTTILSGRSLGMRILSFDDEAQDGGGILDPTHLAATMEARECLRHYIDEHSEQIRKLLKEKEEQQQGGEE